MILPKLKRLIHGYKTLSALLDWRQLYTYVQDGIALEMLSIPDDSATQAIMIIASHPNDEVFGCGGALALHRKRGDTIHVIYLTDGSRGTMSGSRDKSLIAKREQEAKEGLDILGGAEAQFWRFADGTMTINKTTVGLLKGQLEKISPDVIYIPWFGDDQADHRVVAPLLAATVSQIKNRFSFEVRQYEVWTPLIPNRLLEIGNVLKEKIKAIEAHQSQLPKRFHRDGILGLNIYRGAIGGLDDPAEAYLALSADRFLHFMSHIVQLP